MTTNTPPLAPLSPSEKHALQQDVAVDAETNLPSLYAYLAPTSCAAISANAPAFMMCDTDPSLAETEYVCAAQSL